MLANVTIAGNTAGLQSGGISVLAGTITLRNSIVANNTPSFSNCRATAPGTFASQGFNLVFPGNSPTTSCGLSAGTNDLINADPKLGPLRDNGGGMPTMALLAGSAAIDAGSTGPPGARGGACDRVDQRGVRRPEDGDLDGTPRCDIGAFEARLTDLCAQRPPVQLAVAPDGQGGLTATMTRGLGTISQIQFHDAPTSQVANPNGIIQFSGGGTGQGDFVFTPPPGTTTLQFTVRPVDVNRPATVPLDVVDACGVWSTLVGGGSAGAFRGGVGSFAVTPLTSTATVGQTVPFQLQWTLPAPRRWRELASLELRLTDADGVAWGVRWTEVSDAFTITDMRTPGLFTLAGPHTQGSGPTGPSVTLTLPLQVLPAAAGRTFSLEVRATDDTGAVQGFEPAGTLTVLAAASAPPSEAPSVAVEREEKTPKPTPQERWQHAHTNAGSLEDERIEGDVLAVNCAAQPPTITLGDRDGEVTVELRGEAADACGQIHAGQYLDATGEKVHEQLFVADRISAE